MACKTRGITSRGKRRSQAAEMRFLRSVVGITRRDEIRLELMISGIRSGRRNENRIPRQKMDYQLQRWQDKTRGAATGLEA
jgi:predicted DNA-binding ribbon-helix-helix protein